MILENKFVLETCKVGQQELCCRYLLMLPDGWQCGKLNSYFKISIDDKFKRGEFNAKGDNCEGKPFDLGE